VPEKKDFYERRGTIEIYGLLSRVKQNEMMNRAKLVITRSGYSTVMDLAELKKKAILIPTDGQPEQEYLAAYHKKLGNNFSVKLKKLKLPEHLEKAKKYHGYKALHNTKKTIKNIVEMINKP